MVMVEQQQVNFIAVYFKYTSVETCSSSQRNYHKDKFCLFSLSFNPPLFVMLADSSNENSGVLLVHI